MNRDIREAIRSADFEKAISFGATHIRVGSAIFGERVNSPEQ